MSADRINGSKKGMSSGNGSRSTGTAEESVSLREALAGMIRSMTPNPALREDLLQEAMVHLWLTETRRPDQTRSWYLQSCRFHLQHYLNSGRSIDSGKRWRDQLPLTDHSEEEEAAAEEGDSGNSVVNSVSVREIMSLLALQLSKQERAVLDCLADGLGPREIGRKLKLSHTMVIRHRLIQMVIGWRKAHWPRPFPMSADEYTWEAADPNPGPEPAVRAAAREMCERVRRKLPGRLYSILRLYYGEGRTMQEIGERFGISRQRTRQLLVRAIALARQHFPKWMVAEPVK